MDKDRCVLCRVPARAIPFALKYVWFWTISILGVTAFAVQTEQLPFIQLILCLCSAAAILFAVVCTTVNALLHSSRYHFFDSEGKEHMHKENPISTPKQFWEDGEVGAVIWVRYTGMIVRNYGVMRPDIGWTMINSWDGQVTLQDVNGMQITCKPTLALRILQTGLPLLGDIVVWGREKADRVVGLSEELESAQRNLIAAKRDRWFAMSAFEGISLWLESIKRNSRWKHAATLKRIIASAQQELADHPDHDGASIEADLSGSAKAWLEEVLNPEDPDKSDASSEQDKHQAAATEDSQQAATAVMAQ